jgi:threonine dehydratase
MAEGERLTSVGPREVRAAAERIAPWVRTTPVLDVEPDALAPGAPVVLKLELLQHTGSFKVRGAFNRLLASRVPPAGVVAASGGNFGLAVAYAAQRLGHRAVIFVPATSPPVKVERIRRLGAEVHVVPGYYADALAASDEHARRREALVLHAYDQPEVVAGQGTVAVELEAQVRGLDTVLVAVGGGGLIGGVAAWFGGRVRVVGVEPERAPTLHGALAAGRPVDVEVGGIAADSLGARRVGEIAFAIAQRQVERVVLVGDQAIRRAQRWLWTEVRLVAEPGGAAGVAALLDGAYRPSPGERVAVVVCGANTDPATLVEPEDDMA